MQKKTLCIFFSTIFLHGIATAQNYLISTANTSLLITAQTGESPKIQYYGSNISEKQIPEIFNTGLALNMESYPTFGIRSASEKALQITQADGNMSLDLAVVSINKKNDKDGAVTEVVMKDKVYPTIVKQCFKAYTNTDVITTWTEISNEDKKPITLYKFASAFLPIRRGNNWLTHYGGTWGAEQYQIEELLTNGEKLIVDKDGVRNGFNANPSFMITTDDPATEETGNVFGGTLAWSGNYLLRFDVHNSMINSFAGINEDASQYILDPNKTFTTPEFAMTYSTTGKGAVSRSFHNWARLYKLYGADQDRDILLNSWEGVYFNIKQNTMDQLMHDISAMGGELFVMDDGWFGDKYPRDNGSTSLGDWVVAKSKLPEGIEGLLASAKKYQIKFGIWIEPEMANTKSELFEKHPDWVLSQSNRPISKGRGGTQVILDLTNPAVQDFVYGVVDNLLSKHPDIAYIKWDANASIMNYGSHFLPANKQSQIYIDYHIGLNNVLKRIRDKYPKLVLQACASGGGRVDYGVLPYFNEFWTSDNTDALQRIFIQWGTSAFYPAIGMAAHVSANKNHQTGREVPLKFRFDVAMTGRLGLEIQPKDMSEEQKAFATRSITAYKQIRPIVQHGDLYRLVSPYDHKNIAALMYATADKKKCVFYAYEINLLLNQIIPLVKLSGVDENKTYRISDLTPENTDKPCSLHNKIISGKILKEQGIRLPLKGNREYESVVLELTEI